MSYARRLTDSVSAELVPEIDGLLMQRDRRFDNDVRLDGLFSGDEPGWLGGLGRIFQRILAKVTGKTGGSAVNLSDVVSATPPPEPAPVAEAVSVFNDKQWRKIKRAKYGIDVFKSEPWLAARLAEWEHRNIQLIDSIPTQYLEQLQGRIVEAVGKGYTPAQVVDIIHNTYPLPEARARLIARDQVGKLNGQLTRERQYRLGVSEYIWRGVMDSRERQTHKDHEGKRYAWDSPPKNTGHPGEDYQCRCHASPVLPELEDIDWT